MKLKRLELITNLFLFLFVFIGLNYFHITWDFLHLLLLLAAASPATRFMLHAGKCLRIILAVL